MLAEPEPINLRRPSARRWLTSGLTIALLVAIAVHLSREYEALAQVRGLSVPVLTITCLLQLVSQLCLNSSLLLPLRKCVPTLGFWELYLVRTGGFVVGSFVPVVGGLGVRLAYLRSRGLTYLDFTWATLLSNVLALGAAALLGVFATGALWTIAGSLPTSILLISGGLLAMSAAAVALFELLPRLARHPRLARWHWLSSMNSLATTSGRLAIAVFLFAAARHAVNFVTFGWLSQSLSGRPGDFLTGGLVYLLTSPIRMINVTPANLGVTEWLVALVGRALAFDVATGLVVALGFRGAGVVGQALGAAFGSAWLALRGRR